MEVKAAVLNGPKQELTIETVTLTPRHPEDVVVRVVACGVCGSDAHAMDGHFGDAYKFPTILGHEAAGIVEEVGSAVQYVKPGDHVILGWNPGCGRCPTCWNGQPAACPNIPHDGRLFDGATRFSRDGVDIHSFGHIGGFAERVVVGERTCIKIREDAPLEKICLIGCAVATAYGAVFGDAQVQVGSSAAVIGCGGVGMSAVHCLKIAGAAQIIAVDVNDEKLARAEELGATHTINAAEVDAVEAVQELTSGAGVDYAFEVISTPKTVRQAYDMTRYRGTVTVVGMVDPPDGEISIPANPMKVVRNGAPTGVQWVTTPLLVDLYMAGTLDLDKLVGKSRPLADANAAFADLRAGELMRTVLLPSAS